MKRIFTLLLSIMLCASAFSQKTVSFEEIEKNISEHSSYFEGFYIVKANDTTTLGVSYALTYYDPERHIVSLCLPDYSENAYFIAYEFPVSDNDIFEDIGCSFVANNGIVYYSIDDDGNYFYVELEFEMDGMHVKYYGKFEIEKYPD